MCTGDSRWSTTKVLMTNRLHLQTACNFVVFFVVAFFIATRPKPAYGRQGLGWDRQARIQFRQVQFGMDTLLGNIYY